MSATASNGALRQTLEKACAESGFGLGELTVLATPNDPFRVDTAAGHRDGEWLAVQASELGLGDRTIHLRGLHYVLVSGQVIKPDGAPYMNTDRDWLWLQGGAAKAARWLGYVEFDQIVDARNNEPRVIEVERRDPLAWISPGRLYVELPSADALEPRPVLVDFVGTQPFRLVLIGEKTSLEDVLAPIAAQHAADLYLPSGEPSDSMLYRMASAGADDGRRMIVFYFSDCDPAGWQMPISVARKLQAFRALKFNDLDFEVRRVALTPQQVREHGLPSTPLKQTEKRADKWVERMGVAQTEIDALAALQPELLREIVYDAIAPFYDYTLASRVTEAHRDWQQEAQARLDEQLDQHELHRIRTAAEEKLSDLQEQVEEINDSLRIDPSGIDLPPIVIPDPEFSTQPADEALINSDWSFGEQTRRLIAEKAYERREDTSVPTAPGRAA